MKRPAVLLFSLLLLTSAGTAITVDSPASRTHLDAAVSVQVSNADGPVEYSINGGARNDCDCIGQEIAVIAPDGENTLTVYDSDGSTAARTFMVDTEAPTITDKQPFRTTYTQRVLARLSRQLLYVGIPALIVVVVLALLPESQPLVPGQIRIVTLCTMLTIGLSPLSVLAAYLLRIATISERTVSPGPFVSRPGSAQNERAPNSDTYSTRRRSSPSDVETEEKKR